MTIDSEQEKNSMRDKLRSEKVLQQTLQTINADKKNVAIDIRKSQNEIKRKLRKIRDRQREIQRSKSVMEKPPESIEEFLQNARAKNNERRPMTSPPASLRAKISGFLKPKLEIAPQDDETTLDPSFFTDQQRSKIDLRPKTAASCRGNFESLRKANPKGKLGSRNAEERYFEEDEVADRAAFYMRLTNIRRKTEEDTFDSKLETKVGEFLGQSREQIMRRREYSKFLRQTDQSVTDMISKKLKPGLTRAPSSKSIMPTRTLSFTAAKENLMRQESKLKIDIAPNNNKLRAFSAIQRGGVRSSLDSARKATVRIRPMSTTMTSRV
ncbi:hypothetical protein FSP39_000815 [Pinctada imbricata]|uniref:Uncharacterized protein n=1 Tax=Pinctada imbricata TaxID=66713 RepID=A0AA89BVE0_PINIB|nr:hypothetical protein FSP39_000815 [Pinctada imbricata]